jgi:hypothetical protein
MKNKKINLTKWLILFSILFLPSFLYLYLTSGKHNFVYLPILSDSTDNYIPLLDEKRNEYNRHHFIKNFRVNDSLDFSDFNGNIKLIFATLESDTFKNNLINFMIESEIWSKLNKYDSIYYLNFQIETDNVSNSNKINTNIDKYFDIKLPKDSFEKFMQNNIWVGEISNVIDEKKSFSGKIIISDKEGIIRTGFNKKNKIIYVYDVLSKFEIKLLLEDIKLLLAEYQRELKIKK